jgi:hypothetical protein
MRIVWIRRGVMSQKNWNRILGALTHTLLALSFVSNQTAWAAQGQNANDKAGSSAPAKSEKAPPANLSTTTRARVQTTEQKTAAGKNSRAEEHPLPGGQHEGIKVHGHWTIEVRNPNGELVTQREFENSLEDPTAIPQFLGRRFSVGFWQINLSSSSCVPANTYCLLILESGDSHAAGIPGASTNLSVTASGPNGSLVLTGSLVSTITGPLGAVVTVLEQCPATTPPSSPCQAKNAYGVTGTELTGAQSVSVTAGQMIAVTVVISFS